MIPPALLNISAVVVRRTSTGVDILNNPTYGSPTNGTGWNVVYNSVPVRLAFSTKAINFKKEGERIIPTGVVYYNAGYILMPEDRILFQDPNGNLIEYVITSIVEGRMGVIIDHFEALVSLP
jgi:hypothetical protein